MPSPEPASANLDPLIRDLVSWCDREPRTQAEALEAWRTSCPRLTVWEDALDRGLLERRNVDGQRLITVTAAGRAFLATQPAVVSLPSRTTPDASRAS
jgi:hypothetical protein